MIEKDGLQTAAEERQRQSKEFRTEAARQSIPKAYLAIVQFHIFLSNSRREGRLGLVLRLVSSLENILKTFHFREYGLHSLTEDLIKKNVGCRSTTTSLCTIFWHCAYFRMPSLSLQISLNSVIHVVNPG